MMRDDDEDARAAGVKEWRHEPCDYEDAGVKEWR